MEDLFSYLQCVSAIFLVAGTLYASWKITRVLLPDETASTKWCGICTVGLWVAAVGFHILAWTGLFTIWAAVPAVCILVAASHFLIRSPVRFLDDLACDLQETRSVFCELMNPVIVYVFAFFAILVLARDLILPPLAWDTLTYHATKAAMWVQSGNIWLMSAPGGWSYQRSFPGGGELYQAWAMLPFHADIVVCVVDWVQWLCLMIALYSLGTCLALSRRLSLIAAIFCGFLPAVVFSVGACYVDILLALTFVLSAVFFIRLTTTTRPVYIFFEYLAFGVAGGVKLTAYPTMAVMIVLTVLYVLVKRHLSRSTFAALAGGLLCMALTAVPWLVQNSLETGFPFSPLDIKLGTIILGQPSQETIRFQEAIQQIPYSTSTEWQAFLDLFRFPLSFYAPDFGVINLLFLAIFPIGMVIMVRKNPWFALGIFAIIASVVGAYAAPAFTVVRVLWAVANARFLYTSFFLIIMLSLYTINHSRWERFAQLLLCIPAVHFVMGAFHYWAPYEVGTLAIVFVTIFVLGSGLVFLSRSLSYQATGAILIFALIAFFVMLDSLRSDIRYRAGNSYFFHGFPYYWVQSAKLLDDEKHPHSIAVTSGVGFERGAYRVPPWFMYMFMGSRLQNKIQYVPIAKNGDMVPLTPSAFRDVKANYRSWVTRLHQKGITDVMSFFPESLEFEWMKKNTDSFEPLFLGKQFGCFRVR
jgi:hypothetical protein